MIYKALDLGLTLADYWHMTPRGVVALVRERAQDEARARAEAEYKPAASGGYEKNGNRYMRVGRIPR